jgi:DNA-binding Lrp family transcriptional regulator
MTRWSKEEERFIIRRGRKAPSDHIGRTAILLTPMIATFGEVEHRRRRRSAKCAEAGDCEGGAGEVFAPRRAASVAHLTTGEYDYFIKIAVEETSGYEEFLRRKLHHIPGVRHSRSSFTLRCLKRVHSVVPGEN